MAQSVAGSQIWLQILRFNVDIGYIGHVPLQTNWLVQIRVCCVRWRQEGPL